MASLVQFSREGTVGVLCIDNPPVNALSPETIAALSAAFAEFEAAPELVALAVYCAGRTFVAGGDISSFERPDFSAKPYNALLARIEACTRPVVAALHGTVLGGGLELAMACHYRVAHPATRLGLPEVNLGLIPGSLGTQRLPRLVGASLALNMMLNGTMVNVAQAESSGLVDAVSELSPKDAAISAAAAHADSTREIRRASKLPAPTPGPDFFVAAAAEASKHAAYPARQAIVRTLKAAVELPFSEGEQVEAAEFDALRNSAESLALRHLFFAERETTKVPGASKLASQRRITRVAVVGIGDRCQTVVTSLLKASVPTTLVAPDGVSLQRELEQVRNALLTGCSKDDARFSKIEKMMSNLRGSVSLADVGDCELLVEAIHESIDLKQEMCSRLGEAAQDGAIVATASVFADIDVLARASGRPQDFVGLHFVHLQGKGKLLEVVRGANTNPETLAAVLRLASGLGRTPIVAGNSYGFIIYRMMDVYLREVDALLVEGATPSQIDGVVEGFGFPVGPCRMLDLIGLDVEAKAVCARRASGLFPADSSYRVVVQRLASLENLGQKTGRGYYRYRGREHADSVSLNSLLEQVAGEFGIQRRSEIPEEEISERLLYSVVNEGARILEEGAAYRSSDIDVAWMVGVGFPDYRGGPMFMAEQRGLSHVIDRLKQYGASRGDEHGYWTPAPLLESLATQGRRFKDWQFSVA